MLSRIYVAGEDSAHTEFVRGFIDAYRYPPERISPSPSGSSKASGRRGDGKALVVEYATSAARRMKRKNPSSLLVVVHDLDKATASALKNRLIRQIAERSEVPEEWLALRTVVVLPEPETEGWIAQMVDETYRPGNGDQKQRLKKRAFETGRQVGLQCAKGRSEELPEQMRSFCGDVARHVEGLR